METPEANRSRAMQWLNDSYAVSFNRDSRWNAPAPRGNRVFLAPAHGPLEPIIDMPPPPEPPYDVETMEPIRSASVSEYDGAEIADEWQALQRALDEERILVLDAEEAPRYEYPVFPIT